MDKHERRPQRGPTSRGPQRNADGVWTRRRSAAPTVTLQSKLLELRKLSGRALREAEGLFVVEARPFLLSICRWYRGPDLASEDLEAEAVLAFCEAMWTWTEGGRPFDTYARWGVRFALAKMLRASRMIRGRGRASQAPMPDEAAPEAESAERGAECDGLADAVAELSEAEREMVRAWQDGETRVLPREIRARLREMVG